MAQNLQDRQIGFERVSLTLWNGSFSNQLLADLATNQLSVLSALGADTLLWHPAEGVFSKKFMSCAVVTCRPDRSMVVNSISFGIGKNLGGFMPPRHASNKDRFPKNAEVNQTISGSPSTSLSGVIG